MDQDKLPDLPDITYQAFEQSFTAVIITDAQLERPGPKIIYANQVFCDMTGYTKEEIIGQTPRILQGEKSDREVLDRLKTTIERGEFFQGSTVNYTKSGEAYYVEWNISPIRDAAGTITHYLSMQQNVTTKVQLEEEQRKLEIIQERQATMGQMMDIMLHQWNQPLTVIGSIVADMQFNNIFGNGNDEAATRYDEIERNLQLMGRTISTFRDFMRSDQGVEAVNLNTLLEDFLFLFRNAFKAKNVDIVLQACKQKVTVAVDANKLQQVLLSLLSNSYDAITHNTEGKGKITITSEPSHEGAVVVFEDNGGGIPESIIDQVFDYGVTANKPEGTGTGLAIASQLVNEMGGSISVENAELGARFMIALNGEAAASVQ
jgi:PAS domain S-box-containing protein